MILQEKDCNIRQKKRRGGEWKIEQKKGERESEEKERRKMWEVEEKIKMEKNHNKGRKAVEWLNINYVLDTLIIQILPTVSIKKSAFLSSFYRRGIRGWKSNNFHWVTSSQSDILFISVLVKYALVSSDGFLSFYPFYVHTSTTVKFQKVGKVNAKSCARMKELWSKVVFYNLCWKI